MLEEAVKLQNRFAPLPLKLHILFAVFATLLFIVLYIRYKRISDIYWALVLDATLILQFYSDPLTAGAVAVCEILLLSLIAWEYIKDRRAQKALEAQKPSDPETELDELDELVKSERKAIIDDSKVDVIGDAFDGEDAVK